MQEIEFQGRTFTVDEDGFLQDSDEWGPEWLKYVMQDDGIAELTDEHDKVIEFIREFYKKNNLAPLVRSISKVTGLKHKAIYDLFPSGPAKGACRMAGLPKATGCI